MSGVEDSGARVTRRIQHPWLGVLFTVALGVTLWALVKLDVVAAEKAREYALMWITVGAAALGDVAASSIRRRSRWGARIMLVSAGVTVAGVGTWFVGPEALLTAAVWFPLGVWISRRKPPEFVPRQRPAGARGFPYD